MPDFDLALVPDSLRRWCGDIAEAMQAPPEFVAAPVMAALGGVIGRQLGIALKQHERWIERPMLWSAIVGRPSSGKSPALAPVQRMLTRLEADRRADWERQTADAAVDAALFDVEQKAARHRASELMKKGDRGGARAALELAEPEPAPKAPRLVVNDATVEALGEILNENPRGLVQFRDELSGWLASLDREGREADRGFWLEAWNGRGPYTCDRIGRGTTRIEAPAVSIIGGIQPGRLGDYVRQAVRGGLGDDGLLQRFQLAVYPDVRPGWTWIDRQLDPAGEAVAWRTFQRLDRIDPVLVGAEHSDWCDVPFIRLDDEAQDLFAQWQTDLMARLRRGEEPPHLESHLGKYPGTAGRLALVLHMADHPAGPVTADSLACAFDWLGLLEHHARRLYAEANGSAPAHLLLAKRAELPERFTARDVYRRHWAGLDREAVERALDTLVEFGHMVEFDGDGIGRPTLTYRWSTAT